MTNYPDAKCPKCGLTLTGDLAVCQCGHSYYPRPPEPPPFKVKPVTDEEKRVAAAKAGMFLGILSLLGPLTFYYGVVIIGLGLVLSIKGRNSPLKKQANIGLICSMIGAVFWIVGIAIFFTVMKGSS